VDKVGEDAAKPKEAAPRWEVVRGDDGADRSSAATAERESDVAGSNPARRKGGERWKRTEEVRGGFK
jgi:Domain of unknown function (DUF834).